MFGKASQTQFEMRKVRRLWPDADILEFDASHPAILTGATVKLIAEDLLQRSRASS